ncbi:Rv2175c family DNA-binding protein [Pseudonocardia yuanmonensis]|uniref:Rv2175c family DNA-binding protein n=1 Tax=Pseudonocardia yuanmonensis TaxID=1095914 RepID=A0ABP8W6P3_9PSEU
MVTRVSETNGASAVLSDDVAVLPATEVAAILSVPRTRVHQLIKDGQLLSLKREGTTCVPADFLEGNAVVKGLSGTITVLRDGGYPDADILRWLFTEDDSLPGTPIAAIRAGRHREIKRRAQAMAF